MNDPLSLLPITIGKKRWSRTAGRMRWLLYSAGNNNCSACWERDRWRSLCFCEAILHLQQVVLVTNGYLWLLMVTNSYYWVLLVTIGYYRKRPLKEPLYLLYHIICTITFNLTTIFHLNINNSLWHDLLVSLIRGIY